MSTSKVHSYKILSVSELSPADANPRTHSKTQIGQIRRSIRKFGFTNPLLVDETGKIIAGHGRLAAAQLEGMTELPAIEVAGLTVDERRALLIADNQLALNAGWDTDVLAAELIALTSAKFDMGVIGFSTAELQAIIGGNLARGDPDTIPAMKPQAITAPGETWLMDAHRLACIDSTNEAAVAKLFAGARPDMLLTDPPYCSGGFQEAGKMSGSVGTRGTEMVANDTLSTRGYMALMKGVIPHWGAGVVYVFTDWRMWINLFDVVESSGYGVRNMVVWDKGTPGMGAGWRMQHELIMCGVKVKSPFNPKKAQGNVIQAKRTGNILHATEKPVDLLARIMDVTDLARSVADPFTGSGSTLIACETAGRQFFGAELTPHYVDVAVQRWQQYTGKVATLESDGRSFAEISACRSNPAA